MPTSRSYGDACAIARALDVVGERWALLVVRELLLGPQRFSDLRRALPAASSNLVADRLRELTARGVIRRRKCRRIRAASPVAFAAASTCTAAALSRERGWVRQTQIGARRPRRVPSRGPSSHALRRQVP